MEKVCLDGYIQIDTLCSRIVILSAPEGEEEVVFEGSEQQPFYSKRMGKHQWLPNGNLLITEATEGRAFELDPEHTAT